MKHVHMNNVHTNNVHMKNVSLWIVKTTVPSQRPMDREQRRTAANRKYVEQDLDSEIGSESSSEPESDSSSGHQWRTKRVRRVAKHDSDLEFEEVGHEALCSDSHRTCVQCRCVQCRRVQCRCVQCSRVKCKVVCFCLHLTPHAVPTHTCTHCFHTRDCFRTRDCFCTGGERRRRR